MLVLLLEVKLCFSFSQILNERAIKDGDILNTRFQKLQSDWENQLMSTDALATENQARVAELKVCGLPVTMVTFSFISYANITCAIVLYFKQL